MLYLTILFVNKKKTISQENIDQWIARRLYRWITWIVQFVFWVMLVGCTMMQWSAPSAHRKRVPGCVEFACSLCENEGSLRILPLPPTVQKHACQVDWWHRIDPRSECECARLFVSVLPCNGPVQVYPATRSMAGGIASGPPVTLNKIQWV